MRMRACAALAAATALATMAGTTPAHAADITTVGTGFKIQTKHHITHLVPSQQWTITFTSAALKAKYTPYLTRSIAQLQAAGVNIAIGGVTTTSYLNCPAKGTIQFTETYRPQGGEPGMSQALPCWTTEGAARGGHVRINSEYWTGWNLPTYMLHNVFPHEMLHVLGLDHPNVDLDGDGAVEAGECVATSYGNKPVECSPNGGYQTVTNQGKLVGFDVAGVKALLSNAKILGYK